MSSSGGRRGLTRGLVALLLAGAAGLASAPPVAQADPGDLDPGFGTAGVVTTPFRVTRPSEDNAGATLVEPDGKLLVAGTSGSGGSDLYPASTDFALVRYDSDGTLDESFGVGGVALTPVGAPGLGGIAGAVLQPDGKVVVVGSLNNALMVARFKDDGTLDSTFGDGGLVRLSQVQGSVGTSIALEPGGKIVAAGFSRNAGVGFLVARLSQDGSLDDGFGDHGVVSSDIASQTDSVALAPDGRIVVGGLRLDGAYYKVVVARLTSGGAFDASFGSDGVVVDGYGGVQLGAVIVEPDSKILAVGASAESDGFRVAIARYNADGSADQSFGTDGHVLDALPNGTSQSILITGATLQPDGKLVLAGSLASEPFLARYDTDGTRDSTFASEGVDVNDVVYEGRWFFGASLQPDGSIVAAGSTQELASCGRICSYPTHGDFLVSRVEPDGSPDPSFGSGGTVRTNLQVDQVDGAATPRALLVQPDGDFIAAGDSAWLRAGDLALARYAPTGSLDPSFGVGGTVQTYLGESREAAVADALLEPDGKIVVVGGVDNDILLARYDSTGELDPNFGSDGIVTTALTLPARASAAMLEPGGDIVAAGIATSGETSRIVLGRYRPDGTPDETFGKGGFTQVPTRQYAVSAVLRQPSGRIVVVANDRLFGFEPDGTLDMSFGHHGHVQLVKGFAFTAQDATVAGGGRIVVAGDTHEAGGADLTLLRVRQAGDRDPGFGVRGKVIDARRGSDLVSAMAINGNDRIVVTGGVGPPRDQSGRRFVVTKFHANGELQKGFANNGRAMVDVRGEPTVGAPLPGGGALLGGASVPTSGMPSGFELARVEGGASPAAKGARTP